MDAGEAIAGAWGMRWGWGIGGKRLSLGGRCRIDEERHVEGCTVMGTVSVEVILQWTRLVGTCDMVIMGIESNERCAPRFICAQTAGIISWIELPLLHMFLRLSRGPFVH